MQVSDFLSQETTHGLLWHIFASEVGLTSASHPVAQTTAVLQSFNDLKSRLVTPNRDDRVLSMYCAQTCVHTDVVIKYKPDAELFTKLYSTIRSMQDLMVDESAIARLAVYPTITHMFKAHPELWQATEILLHRHAVQWGEFVAKRMQQSLLDNWKLASADLDRFIVMVKATPSITP